MVNRKIRSSSFAFSNQYTPPLFAVFHIDFHLIIFQMHSFPFFAPTTDHCIVKLVYVVQIINKIYIIPRT